ncbi:MAG: transglutaminase family protein [Blastochloris sp.]|nr:transglutaminase family protein [Blastochloris sp.]
MKLQVVHNTEYLFAEKVPLTPHLVFLRPREDPHTRVHRFSLQTMPHGRIHWLRDTQENTIARCHPEGTTRQFSLRAEMIVELLQDNPFDFIIDLSASRHPFRYGELEQLSLEIYLRPLPDSSSVASWIRMQPSSAHAENDTLTLLTQLNQSLYQSLSYQRREEAGIQSPNETLQRGTGSCRDYAVLYMAICRDLGLACRYVSGYLYVPNSLGQPLNRAENAMHAWCEVYLPGAGWRGFDPTHGILTSDFYIPVAVTSFPESVNPIQGSYLSPHPVPTELKVEVLIQKMESS